jgi:hypothetical protein
LRFWFLYPACCQIAHASIPLAFARMTKYFALTLHSRRDE